MEPITWILLVAIIVIFIVLTVMVLMGKKNAQAWLLYAVTQAENQLGGGTGQLKLQTVYDAFVAKFPVVKNFITFTAFKKMVDKALAEMKELAQKDTAIASYIGQKEEA